MSIGKAIKQLREKRNLSQQQMSELLKMGQGTLSKLENEKVDINYKSLIELRKKFGFDVNRLIDKDAKKK